MLFLLFALRSSMTICPILMVVSRLILLFCFSCIPFMPRYTRIAKLFDSWIGEYLTAALTGLRIAVNFHFWTLLPRSMLAPIPSRFAICIALFADGFGPPREGI